MPNITEIGLYFGVQSGGHLCQKKIPEKLLGETLTPDFRMTPVDPQHEVVVESALTFLI